MFNCIFKDGKLHRLETRLHENGQVSEKGLYKYDKQEGVWTEWFENGVKKNEIIFLTVNFMTLTNWNRMAVNSSRKTIKMEIKMEKLNFLS